jgi:hypothetical protein
MAAGYDPSTDPAVQAAYTAYLDTWVNVANLPGLSERSAAEAAAAQEIQYRLYEAEKAHHDAWHAANRETHPELYRDGTAPDVTTPAGWQAKYPLLNFDRGQPTPYDLGLTSDREATWDDPGLASPEDSTAHGRTAEPETEAGL